MTVENVKKCRQVEKRRFDNIVIFNKYQHFLTNPLFSTFFNNHYKNNAFFKKILLESLFLTL